jgi:hypothetical protein
MRDRIRRLASLITVLGTLATLAIAGGGGVRGW